MGKTILSCTDTSMLTPEDPNSTFSSIDNNWLAFEPYNRKTRRYAKKHKITEEAAFKKLYK